MSIQPFLYGDDVLLRLVEDDDLETIRGWADDPAIRPNLRWTGPIPRGTDTEFAQSVLNTDDYGYSFIIEADGDEVGCVMLTNIEYDHGTADASIWLRAASHGNGYAVEATELLLEFAFDTLRLQRVSALSYEYNEPAHAVLEKLGFQKEGTMRHSVYNDGVFYDCYLYGLLDSEYANRDEEGV